MLYEATKRGNAFFRQIPGLVALLHRGVHRNHAKVKLGWPSRSQTQMQAFQSQQVKTATTITVGPLPWARVFPHASSLVVRDLVAGFRISWLRWWGSHFSRPSHQCILALVECYSRDEQRMPFAGAWSGSSSVINGFAGGKEGSGLTSRRYDRVGGWSLDDGGRGCRSSTQFAGLSVRGRHMDRSTKEPCLGAGLGWAGLTGCERVKTVHHWSILVLQGAQL